MSGPDAKTPHEPGTLGEEGRGHVKRTRASRSIISACCQKGSLMTRDSPALVCLQADAVFEVFPIADVSADFSRQKPQFKPIY